jgi:hypothetical protein
MYLVLIKSLALPVNLSKYLTMRELAVAAARSSVLCTWVFPQVMQAIPSTFLDYK